VLGGRLCRQCRYSGGSRLTSKNRRRYRPTMEGLSSTGRELELTPRAAAASAASAKSKADGGTIESCGGAAAAGGFAAVAASSDAAAAAVTTSGKRQRGASRGKRRRRKQQLHVQQETGAYASDGDESVEEEKKSGDEPRRYWDYDPLTKLRTGSTGSTASVDGQTLGLHVGHQDDDLNSENSLDRLARETIAKSEAEGRKKRRKKPGKRNGSGGNGTKKDPIPHEIAFGSGGGPTKSKKRNRTSKDVASSGHRKAAPPNSARAGRVKVAVPGSAMEAVAAGIVRDTYYCSDDSDDVSGDIGHSAAAGRSAASRADRVGAVLGESRKIGSYKVSDRRTLFLNLALKFTLGENVLDWEIFKDFPPDGISDDLSQRLYAIFYSARKMSKTSQAQYPTMEHGHCLSLLYDAFCGVYQDGAESKQLRRKNAVNNLIKSVLTLGKEAEVEAD
jgi:hypothetical protein